MYRIATGFLLAVVLAACGDNALLGVYRLTSVTRTDSCHFAQSYPLPLGATTYFQLDETELDGLSAMYVFLCTSPDPATCPLAPLAVFVRDDGVWRATNVQRVSGTAVCTLEQQDLVLDDEGEGRISITYTSSTVEIPKSKSCDLRDLLGRQDQLRCNARGAMGAQQVDPL